MNKKLPNFGLFEKNRSNPPKSVKIVLHILKPLSDTEILTPELVGDQIEMVD